MKLNLIAPCPSRTRKRRQPRRTCEPSLTGCRYKLTELRPHPLWEFPWKHTIILVCNFGQPEHLLSRFPGEKKGVLL